MVPKFSLPIGIYEKALPQASDWHERLMLGAQAGYDYVEISIDESEERLARLDWPASAKRDLRRAIENTGIPIKTLCLSGHRKYPLGSSSPELRTRALEILYKAICFAADIGIRIVQVMGYDVFYESSSEETRASFLEGLAYGCKWASEAGVILGLENVDHETVDSVEKALWYISQLNSPWLQLYPDMGNLAAAGYDPADELRKGAGHILAIHVKDALPGVVRGVPLGSGIVRFSSVFEALAQIQFWGPLTIEMWSHMEPHRDAFQAIIHARQFVGKLVENVLVAKIHTSP